MVTYRRQTRIDASLEDVWAFHSTTDGLKALTPAFMNLEIESVAGPDGDSDPDVLEAGSRIKLSIRPFGVGPRLRMVSVITERRIGDGSRMFRDVMESGPFAEWVHTHKFFADGNGTNLIDHVTYQLSGGQFGRAVSPLGRLGLELMFRRRHRTTKALLEQNGVRN